MNAALASMPGILFFAIMGFLALTRPASIPRMFGVTEHTPESRTEVRSVYGGFGIAIAACTFLARVQLT